MQKYVYLIKSEETDRYKIGISKNPAKRLKQLQTGNSEKLVLINKYETSLFNKIETTLHNRYSYLKKEGEWFEFGLDQELSFISECENIEKTLISLKNQGNPFI